MSAQDIERFSPRIFTVRGMPVMLDSDLALLYGVETGHFNRAVQRNEGRFPAEFSFVHTRVAVRSTFQPGCVQVTARADGLTAGRTSFNTTPAFSL